MLSLRLLEQEQEKLAKLPIQSAYVRHRKRVVERSLELLSKTIRSQEEEEELAALLKQLELKQDD